MERRLNLASLMGLALLLLATTATAADTDPVQEQESIPGAVPGKRFCIRKNDGPWVLYQQPASYEAYTGYIENSSGGYDYVMENCYDLWYDADHHEEYETLTPSSSYYDAYTDLSVQLSEGESVELGSDIDFGGIASGDTACVAAFKPLDGLSKEIFKGNNHTIKNLCYIRGGADQSTSGIGFFSKVEGAKAGVSDLKFEDVYISTTYGSPAGVVAGMVWGASTFSNITLKNVKVIAATAGGVVGESNINVNSKGRVVLNDIVGENVQVLASSGAVPESDYDFMGSVYNVNLGGLVGKSSAGISVMNVGLTDLKVSSEIYSIEMYSQQIGEDPPEHYSEPLDVMLGGLVGNLTVGSNFGDIDGVVVNEGVDINNTYTVGDVSAPLECDRKHTQTCKVGFVAGCIYAYGETASESIFVGNNYHYGASDYMARNVAGTLMVNYNDMTEQWAQARSSNAHVFHGGANYRNAMALKDRDTLLAMTGMDTISYQALVPDVNNYGGYLADSSMKRDAFAAALNNWQGETTALSRWSRESGVNDGLPVFASENLKAIYWVDFYGNADYYETIKNNSTEKEKWTRAGASIDAASDMPLHLTVATNYTGKIANATWQKNAAGISSGKYYWTYYDEKTQKVSGFPMTTSTVFKSAMTLTIAERTSVTVVHGFMVYDEDDLGNITEEFISVDSAIKENNLDYYFLGEPAKKISNDSTWLRIPYLASGGNNTQYYGFYLANRRCNINDDEEKECFLETMDAPGAFYVDALEEMSNGDTLFVIYLEEPVDVPGGYLYASDLHGEYFDLDKANVQMMARDTTGERAPLGEPDILTIESAASALTDNMLYGAYANAVSLAYSPFFKANYPSDTWNKVTDIVGLVVVGGTVAGGDSYSDALMKSATQALSTIKREHPYLKDTVSVLDSPEEIRAMMDANAGDDVVYARYVHMGKEGTLDLTNLFAAIASVRETEDDYPIYVGLLPQLANMEYHVAFDLDVESYAYGDYSPLFVADAWIDQKVITDSTYIKKTGSESLIHYYDWRLFRTDACYAGSWYTETEISEYDWLTFNTIGQLQEYEDYPFVENEDGSRSLKARPRWEEGFNGLSNCNNVYWPNRVTGDQENLRWNNSIIKDNSEGGNIVLQQVWNGVTLRHMSTSLDEGVTGIYVPYIDTVGFTFEVYADGYSGYELDGDIKLVWEGSNEEAILLKEGDKVQVPPGYSGGMEFYADYTYKKFNIVFESGKIDVLYGENSDSVGTYKLKSEDDAIDLPFWVYTADQCVEGWTVHSNIENQDEPVMEGPDADWNPDCKDEPNCEYEGPDNWAKAYDDFNFVLSEELDLQVGKRQEKYPLYAKWVDAKTCVEELSYKQTKLTESENGSVAFKEIRKDSTGKIIGTQLHKFAKDGTMLLPYYVKGSSFVVQGLPAKDYILDSLVMTLNGKKYVYHEGDTLAGSITKATFAAYFMPENPTPAKFVKSKLLQSGSAIRFEFATNEFGASGASVKVVLEDDDGKVVADSVIQISKTPYEGSWDYYPLRAGTYLLTATVANSKTSDVFEQDFEVKAEIASAAEGGWRMLSLSNVVMDSVTWDDDIRFYWWDDTRNTGAFWQYQRLNRDDKVDDLTGYWYSSLEGRPLVMKKDMAAPKDPVVWNMDSVYTGWNMVANPYGWYVDLYGENSNKKKSATEKSSIEFYSWNDSLGAYQEVDVIGPYEAVWAKVTGPSQWKLPSKPAFVATVDAEGEENVVEPLKKTVELASGGKGWAIRAVLRDAKGKRDSWNFMGVSESGWASEEPPSGMGDHVNLSIKDGNKSLAKSFKKAAGDSYEWTVSLEASGDRTGYLHFEGVRDLNAAGLKVFVTVDGTTTQMAENDTLKVSIGSMAKTATVRVAPSARTVVAQKLNGLRAFQAGNSLQVGFQVSESLAGAKAYVEILDMKGKVLSSVSGTAVSGSNALTLQTPKSGLYMVRVRVGSKQAAGSVAIK